MARAAPPPTTSQPTMESQSGPSSSTDIQKTMIQKFSEQSGMNMEYSKLLVFIFINELNSFYFFKF